MRYPMHKTTRAKLVHLYYELCLVPGVEPRVLRSWADMLSRLLANKPGLKRKLETTDLELPWKPLWRVLQKELWPKSSLEDSSWVFTSLLYIYLMRVSGQKKSRQYFSFRR
jgi:proteasome activator subunit 4